MNEEKFAPGDIILLNLSPSSGNEIRGLHPALIVSTQDFQRFSQMALCCPISSTHNGFSLHIKVEGAQQTHGYIKCEQMKSLDLKSRGARKVDSIDLPTLEKVLEIIYSFLPEYF